MFTLLRPYAPALAVAALVLAVSPAIDEVRRAVFETFPENGVRLVGGVLAAIGATVAAIAFLRIRERRLLRYAGLAAAALLVWASRFLDAEAGGARVTVVERVHLVEYGLLALLFYRGRRPAGDASIVLLPLLWTATVGVIEEGVQWLAPQRVGEARDVAINAWAGLCGVVLGLALLPPERFRRRLDAGGVRLAARSAAALVLALAGFWTLAHTGHVVDDPEAGRFLSWHTADELRATAARRAGEWAADPPTRIPAWGVEDYFMTEAAAHALHRNDAWRWGDHRAAWHENRILELYYAPFLDLRSFVSGDPHRLPEAMRAELERRVPARRRGDFTSPVLSGRVRPWPPAGAVLAAGAVVALVLAALPGLARRRRRGPATPSPNPPGARGDDRSR